MTDPNVDRDVKKAISEALQFFKKHVWACICCHISYMKKSWPVADLWFLIFLISRKISRFEICALILFYFWLKSNHNNFNIFKSSLKSGPKLRMNKTNKVFPLSAAYVNAGQRLITTNEEGTAQLTDGYRKFCIKFITYKYMWYI